MAKGLDSHVLPPFSLSYLVLQPSEYVPETFLKWDKKWFGNKSRGQERLRRMQALHQKMKKKLASAPDEEKRALQNMVEALENEIRTYREDLESRQPLD